MNKEDRICIFTCANATHIQHAIEMLVSCSRVCDRCIDARIIVDCQPQKIENALNSLNVDKLSFKVVQLDLDRSISQKFIDNCTGTFYKMAYARCFSPMMFSDIDLALYLDTDVIAMKDFSSLFSIDMSRFYVSACLDLSMMLFNMAELQKIGTTMYFNSGVMLWNLKKTRESGIAQQIESFVNSPKDWFFTKGKEYGEQSILNWAMKGHLRILDPKFNVQAILLGYPQYDKLAHQFGYNGQQGLITDCVFAHAQGAKPWNDDWATWQAWQVPLKRFIKDAYLDNKRYCEQLGIYDALQRAQEEVL